MNSCCLLDVRKQKRYRLACVVGWLQRDEMVLWRRPARTAATVSDWSACLLN